MVMAHLQLAKVEEAKLEEAMLEEEMVEKLPERVSDFYRGRCVLVTGGSGFVGRVLVEKLLRSCPDIHTIYLLLRTRKGVPPNERLKKLTDVPLFDRLRTEQPDALAKLQVVAGDITLPGLGLSAQDTQLLCERVSVVFHSAASVRFDDPLDFALRTNVCATRDLLELATQMPQLRAFVYVSTTYCNMGQKVYEEKLYPAPADWQSFLKAADSVDPHILRILTEKSLGQHRNTYTFSKILAEHIVNDYRYRLPVGILRPSIVVPTKEEPFPAWIDNFNGLMGFVYGCCKGVLFTGLFDRKIFLDYIPCDFVVKGIIMSSCDIARKGVGGLSVYQAAQKEMERVTLEHIADIGLKEMQKFPFKEMFYYPNMISTKISWVFCLLFCFLHLLPAVLVDVMLFATGKMPRLVRVQRRVYFANYATAWFAMQNWPFVNRRFLSLERMLKEADKEDFGFEDLDMPDFIRKCWVGVRNYLEHESDDNLPMARRRYKRLRIAHLTLKTLFHFTVAWIVLFILCGILM